MNHYEVQDLPTHSSFQLDKLTTQPRIMDRSHIITYSTASAPSETKCVNSELLVICITPRVLLIDLPAEDTLSTFQSLFSSAAWPSAFASVGDWFKLSYS